MSNISTEDLEQALRQCESEPIHQIGQIQSHGALLVLSSDSRRIVLQASNNTEEFFDLNAAVVCGAPLAEVIGVTQAEQIEQLIQQAGDNNPAATVVSFTHQQAMHNLQARVFLSGNMFVLELMRDLGVDDGGAALQQLQRTLLTVNAEKDIHRYFDRVATIVRELTGFDRVMVYRFDSHWEGEVIAESREESAHSYLGARFPASDIPPQARRLYTINLVRQIADVSAKGIPVLPALNPTTQMPLDMTHSVLRSLSPVHVEYLRNMGVSASMSISLLQDGRLWGLIACHHMTPKQVPYSLREAAAFISEIVSTRLTLTEIDEQRNLGIEATRIIGDLLKSIVSSTADDLQLNLLPDLQALLGSTGIVMTLEGKHHVHGAVPQSDELNGLLVWLCTQPSIDVFGCDFLAKKFAPACSYAEKASGILVAPLTSDMRNSIIWLRKERIRTVQWAGSPEKVLSNDRAGVRLSPRKSFENWTESWRGRCEPWSYNETETARSIAQILTQGLSQKRKLEQEQLKNLQANKALNRSQLLLKDAEKIGNVGGWDLFVDDGKLTWTEGVYKIHEADTCFDLTVESALDFYTSASKPVIKQAIRRASEYGVPFDLELEIISAKGNLRNVRAIGSADKEPRRVFGFFQDITELKQKELELRKFKAIVDSTDDAIISKTLDGVIQSWNPGAETIFGYLTEEAVGQKMQILIPLDRQNEETEILARISCGERIEHFETVRRRKDGRLIHISATISPVINERGEVVGASKIAKDITDRYEAESELRLAASVFQNTAEAIMITDADAIILSVNPAFESITGYTAGEVLGRKPSLLRSDHHGPEFYRAIWADLLNKGRWAGEIWNRRKDGEAYLEWQAINRIADSADATVRYVSVFHDITELRRKDEHIRHQAFHDALTGLPNRLLFQERLQHALGRSRREGGRLSVTFIDLDGFKGVNDTLGHDVGDFLLQAVAARIQATLRRGVDTVARLGGDEFVLLMEDVQETDHCARLADKIITEISRPFELGSHEVRVGASMGMAFYPEDGDSVQELMKCADTAMYAAKAGGKGTYRFFQADMLLETTARLTLETELRNALKQRQFVLHYQPQLDLRSGRIVGVEALLRWQHPERGLISPCEFIAVAEEIGLIVPLGDWVFEEACRQLAQWRTHGLNDLRMSVNLSSKQFADPDLPLRIEKILERTDVPPNHIDLEVTETTAMKKPADAATIMRVLTGQKLTLSIDDFGTGYSSLAYLKMFPISTLKIDWTFVKDIEADPDDAGICDMIVLLAHRLGLDVVAEGVETAGQLKFLLSIGCEKIQGYLISKPLPGNQVEKFIRDNPPLTGLENINLWISSAQG